MRRRRIEKKTLNEYRYNYYAVYPYLPKILSYLSLDHRDTM